MFWWLSLHNNVNTNILNQNYTLEPFIALRKAYCFKIAYFCCFRGILDCLDFPKKCFNSTKITQQQNFYNFSNLFFKIVYVLKLNLRLAKIFLAFIWCLIWLIHSFSFFHAFIFLSVQFFVTFDRKKFHQWLFYRITSSG